MFKLVEWLLVKVAHVQEHLQTWDDKDQGEIFGYGGKLGPMWLEVREGPYKVWATVTLLRRVYTFNA